jgi:heme oxygenase (biliverdin-IX-beta and delta-forming)
MEIGTKLEDSFTERLGPRLRRETAELHRRIEEGLGLTEVGLSVERYKRLLESFLGYFEPVEARIAELAPSAPPLGLELPARSQLLAKDLMALGSSAENIAALPRCTDLPRLTTPAHLAGCMYVLEGSRLGGAIVARELERSLGLRSDGASFFRGDGGDVARRFKRVLAWLDEVARAGAPADEIVASACDTFRTLSRWTETSGAWR